MSGWIWGSGAQASPVLGNLQQPAVDGTEAVSLHQWQASAIRLSPEAGVWRVNSLTVRLAQRIPNQSFSFRIVEETAFRPDLTRVKVLFTTPVMEGTGTQKVTFKSASAKLKKDDAVT